MISEISIKRRSSITASRKELPGGYVNTAFEVIKAGAERSLRAVAEIHVRNSERWYGGISNRSEGVHNFKRVSELTRFRDQMDAGDSMVPNSKYSKS